MSDSSANLKFSKTESSKMIQSGRFLTDIPDIYDFTDPRKVLPKFANKAEDLSKRLH